MGEVIRLASLRSARRARHAAASAELYFDLACPFTYLVAERVERSFDRVRWTPASTTALERGSQARCASALRDAAERRARALHLPLVWPERFPADVPAAMRAAAFAADAGCGSAFVIAATRLAFCGGFDLDDPETLAEAAAAAGVPLAGCLEAAGDLGRDGPIEASGRMLLAAGADRLPALRVGRALFWGESRVGEAAAAVASRLGSARIG